MVQKAKQAGSKSKDNVITKTNEGVTKVTKSESKGGYKDSYSKKEYESKEAFRDMKLRHEATAFTKLHNHLISIVSKGQKDATIDVTKILGLNHVDARLPRYVLGFINGGDSYKTKITKFGDRKNLATVFDLVKSK